MTDLEQRIRERAHQIWEEEGRPEGLEQDHWERAAREIDSEEGQPRDDGQLDNEQGSGNVGASSGLQPGGTTPGGGPGAGAGSIGTGGGSTGGEPTGSPKKAGH
ncbi:DUF2934 domain-containing protein [Pelagibacterium sp. H642]|uniref:DUF2934 domain-containing protein n=1 Tax=Pelagibacterium sp. H642 TaxID=1881069 RepID=UPI0028159B2F|nr:DUF2934 domain-containing protein [Pelagibacterium sp. H642]WMT92884.1 DUF2934 domain-containing protein [Pelagibacterium sp. H642]